MTAHVFWRFWLPLYGVLLACMIGGLLYGRRQALELYGSDAAQENWQAWVEEAREQEQDGGPIRRRAPKTNTPPALILMRDHAVVSFAAAIFLTSAVYWSFAFLFHGALTSKPMKFGDD